MPKVNPDEFSLLEEPVEHFRPDLLAALPHHDKKTHTYKAGRVVVPYCFGISKSLHGRICLNDLIFQSPLKENTGKLMCKYIFTFSIKMGFSNWNSPLFW